MPIERAVTRSSRLAVLGLLSAMLLPVLGGCASRDAEVAESEIDSIGGRLADAMGRPLPDTTATSLWLYLERVDYRDAWDLWPGMGEFYGGPEAHGLFLTTYVNSGALAAIEQRASSMPAGAVIVTEAFLPNRTLDNVAVMYKVRGYDPDHGDWFYARFQPDGEVAAAGRVQSCRECHAEGRDYVRTGGFDVTDDG